MFKSSEPNAVRREAEQECQELNCEEINKEKVAAATGSQLAPEKQVSSGSNRLDVQMISGEIGQGQKALTNGLDKNQEIRHDEEGQRQMSRAAAHDNCVMTTRDSANNNGKRKKTEVLGEVVQLIESMADEDSSR